MRLLTRCTAWLVWHTCELVCGCHEQSNCVQVCWSGPPLLLWSHAVVKEKAAICRALLTPTTRECRKPCFAEQGLRHLSPPSTGDPPNCQTPAWRTAQPYKNLRNVLFLSSKYEFDRHGLAPNFTRLKKILALKK